MSLLQHVYGCALFGASTSSPSIVAARGHRMCRGGGSSKRGLGNAGAQPSLASERPRRDRHARTARSRSERAVRAEPAPADDQPQPVRGERHEHLRGPATPGTAQCLGKVLRARSDGSLVRPHVRATRAYGMARRAAAPGSAPAQSLPSATTPAWLQQAYDLTFLSQTRGVGNTVGIVDAYDDPTAEADLAVYRSRFGLPPCTSQNGCFAKVNQNGGTSPMPARNAGWEQEIALDIDAVSALCPNCKSLLVEANSASTVDLNAAFARAVSMGANELSDSWGLNWSAVFPDA
jgi:hypothetical protein